MSYRKPLFGLDEVGAELESLKVPRWHITLLSDLQQGALVAVVKFPSWRDTYTRIPNSVWHENDVVRIFKRPGRHGWKGELEFTLTVNDFYSEEEELLRETLLATSLRDSTRIPVEARQAMNKHGYLKASMKSEDWEAALKWLADCWRQLSELSGGEKLYPMVEAHVMRSYLQAVKQDRSNAGKLAGDKNPGGRAPNPHWSMIYETAIKMLASRPNVLQSGKVQEFAIHLHTHVKKTTDESRSLLPAADTIAGELRRILR